MVVTSDSEAQSPNDAVQLVRQCSIRQKPADILTIHSSGLIAIPIIRLQTVTGNRFIAICTRLRCLLSLT